MTAVPVAGVEETARLRPRPSNMDRSGVRAAMKLRTDAVHQRLHELDVNRSIMTGTVVIESYRKLLRGFLDFHRLALPILESGYEELAAAGFAGRPNDHVARIKADLTATGGDILEPPSGFAQATCPAEAVGWVWTVEGSALGARLIHRGLDSLFGDANEGRTYFQPNGDSVERWRGFCRSLDEYGNRSGNFDALENGASAAFKCIEQCLATAACT